MPDVQKARSARFGPYQVDFSRGELRKHGLRLKASGQPIRILEMLLESPGEVVSREQIRDRLWPANTFVDFDHGLNAAMNKLREALGDSADKPKYIETLPRRGYRFIGEITPIETSDSRRETTPAAPLASVVVRHDRQRLLAIALAISCCIGLVLAYLLIRPKRNWRVTIAREAQITSSSDLAVYPSFSPDATRLAYSVERGKSFEIVVRQLEGAERELPITDDGQQNIQASWSPDGQTIVYHSRKRGGIWAVPALGGTPKRITEIGSHPAWSPDGQWIAFQSGPVNDLGADGPGVYSPSLLWIVHPDGTGARRLTSPGNPEGGHGAPSWSPDGRHIVFVSIVTAMGLHTVDVQSGEVKTLAEKASVYFDPVYSADGRSVFVGVLNHFGIGLFQMPVSKDGSAAEGTPVQLRSGDTRVRNLSLSRDGTKMLYSGVTQVSGVWSISDSGKAFGEPNMLRQRIGDRTTVPRISPDGKKLLVGVWRIGLCCEIWMMNSDGSDAKLLNSMGGHQNWLPDGKNIVYLSFQSGRDERLDLLKMNIDTRGSTKIEELPRHTQSIHISDDGRQLVYSTAIDGITNLWVLNLSTGSKRQLTSVEDFIGFPNWSPDGLRIVADTKRGEDDQAFVVSAKDGKLTQVTNDQGQHWPASWTRDSKNIIMAAQHDGIWNVYLLDLTRHIETPLTHYTSQHAFVRYPQLSPNGKQIIYEYTETRGNIWMLSLKQDQGRD